MSMNKNNNITSQKKNMSGDKETSYCTNYYAMQIRKRNKNMDSAQQN